MVKTKSYDLSADPVSGVRPTDEAAVAAGSVYELLKLTRTVCESAGYAHFALITLPKAGQATQARDVAFSNWPQKAILALGKPDSMAFFSDLQHRLAPVRFDCRGAMCEALNDIATARCEGLCVPLADAAGQRYVLIFARRLKAEPATDQSQLVVTALHLFERYKAITGEVGADEKTLTARETECLSWISQGKTSLDVAAILGISPHTVNHYLIGAQEKLDALNRTQAVAIAMRKRLIE
jgi:LuxR family quorum sensing-dependent transcriptional regulator